MLLALADVLGETLRAFQLRRRLARTERLDAGGCEIINNAGGERRFRPDDHEIDGVGLAERDHGGVVGDIQRDAFGFTRDAGVARRHHSFVKSGEAAIFHASACSRPPEPIRRIFMKSRPGLRVEPRFREW